jgi:hypothetical protein
MSLLRIFVPPPASDPERQGEHGAA